MLKLEMQSRFLWLATACELLPIFLGE